MKKLTLACVSTVLAAMLGVVPASFSLRPGRSARSRAAGPDPRSGMSGRMKMDATMMAEMAAKKKANTERIAALMAQVKSSTGDAKVAALADVVDVLLEERAAMGEHCASMMSMMKK